MSAKKPLIGITCNYDQRDGWGKSTDLIVAGQDGNYVASDYANSLVKAGATPVLIPQLTNFEDLLPLLEILDGVLVSGGHDVNPGLYNEFPKAWCGPYVPARDDQDVAISKYAMERDLPMLGICRGIQIINVACGGTLYQDVEKDGGFEHHSGSMYLFPRNHAWHTVTVAEDSILRGVFGKETVSVNSYHHQAVKAPGEGVRVTAVSSDGVSEGIEIAGKKFAVGVQWHPEMMYDSDEQLKLFKAFVGACR